MVVSKGANKTNYMAEVCKGANKTNFNESVKELTKQIPYKNF